VIAQCASGMIRMEDHAHCCWPGQGWSVARTACVGIPQCPKGFEAGGESCVSPDRDGDGIPNARDACPDQPEDINSFEDADGCPDEPRRIAAMQQAEQERRAAEFARSAVEGQAAQIERNWQSAVAGARTRRTLGLVVTGVGILAGVGSFVFMGLGAGENGSIRNGSFATGSDIANAASSGSTDNTVAIVLGLTGILGCGAGVPLFLTNLGTPEKPKIDPPRVSLSPMSRSPGVLATVSFE
jgi:hypothetical protein